MLALKLQTTFTYLEKKTSYKTNVPEPGKWREKKVIFIHKTIFLEALERDTNRSR